MWDLGTDRRPSEIKAHPRWVRQARRQHQRDRSRPWRAPNPGEIDEELNTGGSWSTSRPPRLPDAAATSSARVDFLFGVLRRPLRAHQGRQGYSSSASGRRRPLLRDRHDHGQAPVPPRVPGSRGGSPRPLYSTSELRSRPGRRRRPWPRAWWRRPGPPSFGDGRPAAERAWRPDASPPGRAPLSRGGPRWVPVAGLGFRRPACSPLAVVASEPTLGVTAYVGGGGAGVRSRSPPRRPGS